MGYQSHDHIIIRWFPQQIPTATTLRISIGPPMPEPSPILTGLSTAELIAKHGFLRFAPSEPLTWQEH